MTETTFADLRAFLDVLRRQGDLAVIEAPVDARLEAAEIHRRVIAAGGPALLFTKVRGADFPLVIGQAKCERESKIVRDEGCHSCCHSWV